MDSGNRKISAGRRFSIFMLLISNTLRPIAIIKAPPTALISFNLISLIPFFKNAAIRVIPPWKISIGNMENMTPTPNFAANIIALMPSRPDFTNSKFRFPWSPSSSAPRIVSEPMQNNMKAVVIPSAKLLSVEEKSVLRSSAEL